MKNIINNLFKLIVVLILSIMITYFLMTIKDFIIWFDRMQISLIRTENEQLAYLKEEEINYIGKIVEGTSNSIEEYFKDTEYEKYDTVGLAVWRMLQAQVHNIMLKNIHFSIVIGMSITISYIIIFNRNIRPLLKFILGYLSLLIIIPPIYMYSYTGRFWDFSTMYLRGISVYFYIIYTLIVLIMIFFNHKKGIKISKQLNEELEK